MTEFSLLTDQQLMLLLKEPAGKAAYTEIYHRYKGQLYQHAYKKLRNQEEADDIIHELFATLWEKRSRILFNESLSGYLYTAVRNRVLDFISRQQIRTDYVKGLQEFIDKGIAVTDHRVRASMLQEVIDAEVAGLPEKMREIFELSRIEQLSHKEISEKLGISEKTVKNQINNSLKVLRKRLGVIIYLYLLMKLS